MGDTTQLCALLSGYLQDLDDRRSAVDDLRRRAVAMPRGADSAEVLTLLDSVAHSVHEGDQAARLLLHRLQPVN